MKLKASYLFFLAALLTSCAKMETTPPVATIEPEPILEQFDIGDFSGQKQILMVFPWNISIKDLEKYPILRQRMVGFGVSAKLADTLETVGRFEFAEEKQEIIDRMVTQMQTCQKGDFCGKKPDLQIATADYIVYPEVYQFGVEKQTDINGVVTSNRQIVEIGIKVTVVDAHTLLQEASGSYIGQKVLTSEGDIFNNPTIDFSQSALGKAADAAVKGAVAKMLKRFDKKLALKPPAPLKPSVVPEAESVLVEVTQRGGDSDKKLSFATHPSTDNTKTSKIPVLHPEKRLALVIGNGHYQKPGASLDNSLNDAKDMAALLKRLGFDVSLYEDLTKPNMEQAIDTFGQKLKSAGSKTAALFYYAGHAAEVEGINYLFPTDVKLETELGAEKEAVAVQALVKQIESSGTNLNIVMLDACRDNPYPRKTRSFASKSNRLATMPAPTGTIIAYSTSSGKQASDGDGKNGLYTGELLKNMRTPHLKIEDILKNVRIAIKKSGNDQVPWVYSSLEGDFYFIPPK
jgi:Caspase domain